MKKKVIISMLMAGLIATGGSSIVFADEVITGEELEENVVVEETILEDDVIEEVQENIIDDEENTEIEEESKDVIENTEEQEDSNKLTKEERENAKEEKQAEREAKAEAREEKRAEIEQKLEAKEERQEEKANKLEEKAEKIETKNEKVSTKAKMKEMKELVKASKIESLTYLKEIRKMYRDGEDKESRKEILAELAAVKNELKDYSIDTFVNGLNVDFEKYDNVAPVIENGRTLAPIRAITEALGAEVKWDADTQEISIEKDDMEINMVIGETEAYVNGEEVELDVAPEVRNGRTLVPVRFIAESFELNVEWDEASKSIIIL